MIYNITHGNSPDSDPDGGAILNNFVLGNQNELPILGDHNPFNVDHLSIR